MSKKNHNGQELRVPSLICQDIHMFVEFWCTTYCLWDQGSLDLSLTSKLFVLCVVRRKKQLITCFVN